MLTRSGQPADLVSDEVMAAKFSIHLRKIAKFLAQAGWQVIEVDYAEVITDPRGQAARVNAFLGGVLDQENMVRVVDNTLYRQRR